jgi:hypothetical protein
MKERKPPPCEQPDDGKTALERMADLTRRIVRVPKGDLPDKKRTKRKRH